MEACAQKTVFFLLQNFFLQADFQQAKQSLVHQEIPLEQMNFRHFLLVRDFQLKNF